ncbi:MAG: family finger-like domain/tetratricopeptide repeat protein, partial [Myxococcaceae bacterium]|nr:family finger-like domain/tetratricopeptide repeat protein [Myxococcaceae bacterium]
MKVACPSCNAHLNIDDKKIPAGGARIKCPTCQQIFPVKPPSADASGAGAIPLPGPTARMPSAMPAISAAKPQSTQDWEEESTRVMPAEMIPGALTNAAPPSNVHVPAPPQMPATVRVGAVPLPGQAAPPRPMASPRSSPIPLPGITAAKPQAQEWEEEKTRVGTDTTLPPAAYDFDPAEARPSKPRAIPLPGISAAKPQSTQDWEDEKTRVGTEAAQPAQSYDFDPSASDPIPLPGNYEPTRVGAMPPSIPLPGAIAGPAAMGGEVDFADDADVGFAESQPTASHAIPLPGNYQHTAISQPPASQRGAIPLPGSYAPTGQPPAPQRGAVPLPGSYAPPSQPQPLGAEEGDAIPLPGSYAPTGQHQAYDAEDGGAIPLPGNDAPTGSYASLTGEELPPPPDPFEFDQPPPAQTVPAAPNFDFSDLPSPKGVKPRQAPAISFEAPSFDDPPPPPARPASKAPAPDYSDLPSPRGAVPTRADRPAAAPQANEPQYTDLPSPAAAADPFEMPDFSTDLPMPSTPDLPAPAEPAAADFSFDMAPPPPVNRAAASAPPPAPPGPPQAAPSFGEVEFEGANESLEFDPTSAPKGTDDLEADLSAPPVSAKPAASADGLEMLSFIDSTAREAGAKDGAVKARRFHIRRRSGKVFGPFEDAVIIKMLEDGQLLGNEEVSLDSESWQPIGGEASFQAAITKLMETPSKSATTTNLPQVGEQSQQQAASMDRLKNLYEGRMAAVAVVQGKEPVPFRKRLPFIAVGILVLAAGSTGAFLGTTPYGFFGLKVLFPAKVKAGTREFAELREAQKALLSDTFKGYQQARETALSTLRVKEYPEARAIWCQSIFYLQRKYAAASPAEMTQAQAELENIKLLGAKHPEAVKARAGLALTNKNADEALALLGDALARTENADDVELAFLRAEGFVQKNQLPQARSELEAILKKKPDSARALHALGNLHQLQKEADLAAGRYEEAIKADPDHASSAVELAAIELLIRKDLARGSVVIEQALGETRRDKLGPAELGKALALKAETLAMQHKSVEAIPLFKEALKADEGNSFTKARLAAAYVALHDHAKALPYFKEAAEASPESLEYAEAYLSSLIVLGKMEDAMGVVAGSTARFPANARLIYLSARVDDALDRTKEAEAAYLRAAAADPTLVEAQLYLARLYLRFRRVSDAKPQLEEALKRAPDNAEVRVVMGELALSDNDPERAELELKRAVELNPTLSEAYVGISKLELSKGRVDLALEQVDKALKINPRVFGGRVQRGTALW